MALATIMFIFNVFNRKACIRIVANFNSILQIFTLQIFYLHFGIVIPVDFCRSSISGKRFDVFPLKLQRVTKLQVQFGIVGTKSQSSPVSLLAARGIARFFDRMSKLRPNGHIALVALQVQLVKTRSLGPL